MSHADSAEHAPVEPRDEGWGMMLLVMGPTMIVSAKVLIGMILWPVQQIQCGTFDFLCGFGATFDGMARTLMHYPPIFLEIPMVWFLVMMIVVAILGDH